MALYAIAAAAGLDGERTCAVTMEGRSLCQLPDSQCGSSL